MNKWQTPETAPKDDVIIANLGFPFPLVATWNKPSGQWVTANLEVDLYHGEWNDTSFCNEYFAEKELLGWMPLPEVKHDKR